MIINNLQQISNIGWQFIDFGSQYLYVHPDCELNKVFSSNADLILIGHVINPNYPEKTSLQVLHQNILIFSYLIWLFSLSSG